MSEKFVSSIELLTLVQLAIEVRMPLRTLLASAT